VPDKTLRAFADHGQASGTLAVDGGDAEEVVAEFTRACVNDAALAEQLQREGTEAFAKSWRDLMERIDAKGAMLAIKRHDHEPNAARMR
jgi:transaldolase